MIGNTLLAHVIQVKLLEKYQDFLTPLFPVTLVRCLKYYTHNANIVTPAIIFSQIINMLFISIENSHQSIKKFKFRHLKILIINIQTLGIVVTLFVTLCGKHLLNIQGECP